MKKLTYEKYCPCQRAECLFRTGKPGLSMLWGIRTIRKSIRLKWPSYQILKKLGYDAHMVELVRIAGYMHDLGNSINRVDHAHTGALMAFHFLRDWGAPPEDIAAIISAIGQHDERSGIAFDPCLPPLSWPTRAMSARTASATPYRKPSTNTTASIMLPCRRSSTSTRTRKSLP